MLSRIALALDRLRFWLDPPLPLRHPKVPDEATHTLCVHFEGIKGRHLDAVAKANELLACAPNALGAELKIFDQLSVGQVLMNEMGHQGETWLIAVVYFVPLARPVRLKGRLQVGIVTAENPDQLETVINLFCSDKAVANISVGQHFQPFKSNQKPTWIAKVDYWI